MRIQKWVLALVATFGISISASAVEVSLSCGAVGIEEALCWEGVELWEKQSGHKGRVVKAPVTTDQRFELYLKELKSGDHRTDVYQIDVIWPGLLAEYFIDLRSYIPEEEILQHYPAILANNTVDGRLIGMPWFTDVGLLYYRVDLLTKYGLRVPDTWAELADVALQIQTKEREENPLMWGFIFQGEAYEGLTCDALEWIASYGGGTILDSDGAVTVNNPRAVTALQNAAMWVGTIAPERVLSFREEDARLTFNRGDAAFMRNWPYVWNMLVADNMSPVVGKVGVAPLPKGGRGGQSTGTLGGWQLAINKHSKHPKIAADLVRFLTGREEQKRRAVTGSMAPTIRDLYEDPEVLRGNPIFIAMDQMLSKAVARPSAKTGPKYRDVSKHFSNAVHKVLSGEEPASKALARLEKELNKLRGAAW